MNESQPRIECFFDFVIFPRHFPIFPHSIPKGALEMRTSLDATRRRRGGLNPDHMIPKLALEDMNKKGGGGETAEQCIQGDGRPSFDETGRRERGRSWRGKLIIGQLSPERATQTGRAQQTPSKNSKVAV